MTRPAPVVTTRSTEPYKLVTRIGRMESVARPWGDDRALLDDEEARRRLLDAASRCIASRGNTQIRMAEVAAEAGVVRSTVYRYFASRDNLLLALLVSRTDAAVDAMVRSLSDPGDARRSIADLIIGPIALVEGDALNEALFAAGSTALASTLELGSDAVIDVLLRHYQPLMQQWQADGQVHADLDLRDTVRWVQSAWLVLLAPPWRERSLDAKRQFIEQYLLRALIVPDTR